MQMNEYVTLGRSGLRVSPLALGTMTFGNYRWGSEDAEAQAILNHYLDAGGNFLDVADVYAEGKSEELLGKWIRQGAVRDRVVIATKYTFNAQPGDPNAGGNGRKNMYRALEGSLRRLGTDYIDLYWMHVWDTVTPIEEVIGSFDDLVASGKIRYYGFSDVPAWYVSRAQTLAELHFLERVAGLQLEYSLVERNIEREHIPAARELGIGVCPWSPLASGFLAGKYTREGAGSSKGSRLDVLQASVNPVFHKFTERNWQILEVVQQVAKELGRSPAEVALNWVATQPGITSTIIGATRRKQLEANLAALALTIPVELRQRLDDVSRLDPAHPYMFFEEVLQDRVHGGVRVRMGN